MKKLILNEDLFEPFEFSELFPGEDIIEGPADVKIPAAAIDAGIDVVEEEMMIIENANLKMN